MIVSPVLDEVLCEDTDVALYRAHTEDGRRVLMRVLKAVRPTSAEYESLRRESEVARIAGPDVTAEPEGVIVVDGKPTLVLRDDGGAPLRLLLGEPMPLAVFFPLAIELVGAVSKVHERHLVHGELDPANVLKLRDGRIELIGFGRVDCAFVSLPPASPIAARPYLAPEQIGRHPHIADERSDLYSLGVILFEMLAGKPPFQASDLVAWVHAHCALPPPPLSSFVENVPPAVSDIVTKLLAKAPEARYQAATALRLDLERAFDGWKAGRECESFPLGTADRSPPLRVSGEIHGRRSETRRLRLAITRTGRAHPTDIVLVRGRAGIGKTSLVRDALRGVVSTERPPMVATGRCCPTRTIAPLAALVEAFDELLRASLDVSADCSAISTELADALGSSLPLLAKLVPELGRLVPGRRAGEAFLPETEPRLFRALDRLVATFSSMERPLVLVLEDLQWCDAVTLDVLAHWTTDPTSPPLVIVGTYRTGEESLALRRTLAQMADAGTRIEEISLEPLSQEAMSEWVADILRSTTERVVPLATMLHRATNGEPLFGARLLEALHGSGAIRWDAHAGRWEWTVYQDMLASPTFASSTTLVRAQLDALPEDTRTALGCFAAYGPTIDPETLALVLGCSEREALGRLCSAFTARLVTRATGAICFVHPCVAEMAYAALGDAREDAHLRLGRALLEHASGTGARIFGAVSQLGLADSALVDPAERARVAALHLAAARKAQASTHFAAAVPLLVRALELLGDDGRDVHHELAFALRFALARSFMTTGEDERGRAIAAELLERARTPTELAAVRRMLAELDGSQGRLDDALDGCLAALRSLGIDLPRHPSPELAARAADRALERIDQIGTEALLRRSVAADASTRAVGELVTTLFLPATFTDTHLLRAAAAAAVERFLDDGNAPGAALAYAVLAVRRAELGRSFEAQRLGDVASTIAQRDEEIATRPRAALVYLAALGYLAHPARECAALLLAELDHARAIGDRSAAALLAKQAAHYQLFAGVALESVARTAAHAVALARESENPLLPPYVGHLATLVDRLRTPREHGSELPPLDASPAAAPRLERFMQLCYELVGRFVVDGDGVAAWAAAAAAADSDAAAGHLELPQLHFFGALALARAAASEEAAVERLAAVEARLEALRARVTEQPLNFGARTTLVTAERDRLAGNAAAAEHGYESAIRLARASGEHNVEAHASECAARFYRGRGLGAVADAYVVQAHACYEVWGARATSARFVREHPFLAERPVLAPDLEAILGAQRAIASSLFLPEVRSRVVEVALEQAGAQRGCLLELNAKCELVLVAASGTAAAEFGPEGLPAGPLRLPLSMCDAAVRIKKPTLVADTVVENRYSFDPYFADTRARMRSALCLPIVRQGAVVAVLYLENEVAPGLFSTTKLAILDSIATQAGISLENARVHTELERENAERRSAETSLSKKERLFESALDATPLIVQIKDLDGRYLFVNRRYEEVFNIEAAQLVGKTDYDLVPRAAAEAVRALDHRSIAEDRALEFDETIPLGDGLHSYRTVKFPLRDENGQAWATCGFASDFTIRRHAEEELRRTLSLLEATFESTHNGIVVVDRELRVVRWNHRFLEMWSIPATSIHVGSPVFDLAAIVTPQLASPDSFLTRLEELRRSPEEESVDTVRLKDGRVYERFVMPQRLGGEVVGRVINLHDVSEKVRAAEERTRLLAEEKRARAEAEDAVHARDEFLSIASHELRTPLASLSLAVETLAASGTENINPDRVRRSAAIAKRQVQRIVSLVEMLLDVSRLRSGKLLLSPGTVDLRTVIDEVTTLLSTELARSGSKLEVHAPEPVVGHHWDALRIEQVVTNLLTNAIKFGRGAPIEVDATAEDGRARLVVTDRGIGIPEEPRARIFEPFTRLVSSRHFGGLGLGLHITKSIVEAHGGTLEVESEEGVGSKFIVTLPL